MKTNLKNETAIKLIDKAKEDIQRARSVFDAEIQGLREVRDQVGEDFHRAVETICKCKGRLIVSGVGKSGVIAKKIAATLTSTGTPSFYIHPVEAAHGDLGLVSDKDVVLFVSKSGMSDELRQLLPSLGRLRITIIAITGNRNSLLAKHSDIVLHTKVSREACAMDLAPTTSTTAALVMGDALASALIDRKGFKKDDFARFHPNGILGRRLTLTVEELMRTGEDVPLVKLGTTLKDALLEIIQKRVGCTGVVDDKNKLRGIITDGDLKRILVKKPDALKTPVREVMTPEPKKVPPDILASDALSAMEFNPSGPITMFFVTDSKDHPIGIIHIHDILKAGLNLE
ncbi:MAG: KpsF/GutQ family sugar-phosphate isomerase [Candidatus Latescibacteria bacterium]|nr:KpsF/GutQ family sugar-phosphate isomerase [Candidatus Latescibacterota bacterium]NIM22087.1 KpsF/GutQ family sugar-phosphate isomerase [Candidatus Latescibacterota bacterium]NIM66106.1 KpsF/GutQ family sugar-phosphate isomerase [Candidatus Latescibacterota bacterium]NIO02514.1 KpsF/GutQ family sugar-phosphate isomerase [Candidatus Latescibacterota bacterium]NIO29425.1 KpsF/GutQ family sugar-phosphate isomerase [Candidatus Latescibacterota bacterium]